MADISKELDNFKNAKYGKDGADVPTPQELEQLLK